ncbi:hypothetical protein [Oceanobacillus bengalensis]|uniref:Uncharacterized protein n=1 Tax=Oceanobacillus bengalensis TaxID=1435466 RepID=A0A494YY76_9BACI|nr:hypothetical protein [Oceanobacillus bengalensis]RKQ14666.1 hypothetical protein D8M05_12560 [Oceanobacillus bengalensis]
MIINTIRLRDEKIANLKLGRNAYAESPELIRLIKRDIERQHLQVFFDHTDTGCWFIPADNRKTS